MHWLAVLGLFKKKQVDSDELLPPPPPFPGFEAFEKAAREKEASLNTLSTKMDRLPRPKKNINIPSPRTTTEEILQEAGFEDASRQRPTIAAKNMTEPDFSISSQDSFNESISNQPESLQSIPAPVKRKSFFSRMLSRHKDMPMSEPIKIGPADIDLQKASSPGLAGADLNSVNDAPSSTPSDPLSSFDDMANEEIDEAISDAKIPGPKEDKTESVIFNPADEVERIEEQIHRARLALMDFKLDEAQRIYLEILKQYQALPAEKKHSVYSDINDLYNERKNAQKYAAS